MEINPSTIPIEVLCKAIYDGQLPDSHPYCLELCSRAAEAILEKDPAFLTKIADILDSFPPKK
jgi:hypothetical protein